MPPKKPSQTPKAAGPAAKPTAGPAAKPAAGRGKPAVQAKRGAVTTHGGAKKPGAGGGGGAKGKAPAAQQAAKKPPAKQWTPRDDAARRIQTNIRRYLAQQQLRKLRQKKQEYDELMDKLEKEAYARLVREEQQRHEEQLRKEDEERRLQKEHSKRKKRFLEAAFDGELQEIKDILREIKELDDKNAVGTDTVGLAIRKKHRFNMIVCTDANGNSAVSEAASGGQSEVIEFLMSEGADPNSVGQFGRTPLYRAAFAGHLHACQTLLQSGADPRIFAEDGQTPEQVTTISPVTELLQDWSIEQTEKLLEKIEQDKEARAEEEMQRRRAESNALEDQVREAERAHRVAQKRLLKATEELNKRIHEHDKAEMSGFDKVEVTLKAVHDAETELELARVDIERARDGLSETRLKLREQKAKYAKEDREDDDLPGNKVNIRELDDVLLRDVGNRIKDSGKWPLLIDPSEQASTFLRYRDTNYMNALRPADMEPEKIRLAVLGAIRFGKPVVLDMMQVDMYDICVAKFNEVQQGLLVAIMNKSVLEPNRYLTLIRRGDHEEYHKNRFNEAKVQCFRFIIITRNPYPPQDLLDMTYPIRIHVSN